MKYIQENEAAQYVQCYRYFHMPRQMNLSLCSCARSSCVCVWMDVIVELFYVTRTGGDGSDTVWNMRLPLQTAEQ